MEEETVRERPDGTATLKFPRVGHLFRSRRVARHLRIVELARMAGLGDKARVLRHIDRLEQHGFAPIYVVRSLCAFFGIDLQDVREARKLDEADRKRLQWESTGGRPYLVVRFMAAVYRKSKVPDGLEGSSAIEWAQSVLSDRWRGRFKGCLVLSPDEIAWFEEDVTYRLRRDLPLPSMSTRGKRFMFTE